MELQIIFASHALISKFLKKSPNTLDEIIFLDFRPFWLSSQKNVYIQMQRFFCEICFNDYFIQDQSKQHNNKHPPICVKCYKKLFSCPFCREPLLNNIICFIR